MTEAATDVLTIQGPDLSGSAALMLIMIGVCIVLWLLISIIVGQIRKKKLMEQLQKTKHRGRRGSRFDDDSDDEYTL